MAPNDAHRQSLSLEAAMRKQKPSSQEEIEKDRTELAIAYRRGECARRVLAALAAKRPATRRD
jgi:hypothetical protein